jgi:hypothetical protein
MRASAFLFWVLAALGLASTCFAVPSAKTLRATTLQNFQIELEYF